MASVGRTDAWRAALRVPPDPTPMPKNPWNSASFRVLEKIGFRRDHSVTDERRHLVYMLRDV